MLGKLLFHIVSGILGLFLAIKFIPGVEFAGPVKTLLIAGLVLGLVNFFVKPILKKISLPLRIITFGLFSLIINMFLVWVTADILFPGQIEISGLAPLFWTTLIIWGLNFIFGLYKPGKKAKVVEVE